MKKSIFALIAVIAFCVCFSVTALAIDTPWIPIEPDAKETQTSSPSQSTNNDNGNNTADTDNGAAENTVGADGQTTGQSAGDGNASADGNNDGNASADGNTDGGSGCGGVIEGYAILACGIAASACVIKSRKETE